MPAKGLARLGIKLSEFVRIRKIDETWVRVEAESSITEELFERFTFMAASYKYHPLYRSGRWDGKIRLFDKRRSRIYIGLVPQVRDLCERRGYDLDLDEALQPDPVSHREVEEFIRALDLPSWLEIREHQVRAVAEAIGSTYSPPGRGLLLSPTSSGKSFIIYVLTRWYSDAKFLIIVPTTTLVRQMASDFESYGGDPEEVQQIMAGMSKEIEKRITVSTWQSIFRMDPDFFEQFEAVVGDEAHECTAKSLVYVMESCTEAACKWGFTGTLSDDADAKVSEMTLTGLFGPKSVVSTTHELQKKGIVAQCEVKAVVLDYPEEVRKQLRSLKWDYTEELKLTTLRDSRIKFVKNLALSLRGNTLVMFRNKEHGRALYDALQEVVGDRKLYYVDGGVKTDERVEITDLLEEDEDAIAVVSLGTFRRGISINKIHNIVAAAPVKSSISVLQSIGRGLRLFPDKILKIFDIGDDLSTKRKRNHTLNHFAKRIGYYAKEKFPYKIVRVKLP